MRLTRTRIAFEGSKAKDLAELSIPIPDDCILHVFEYLGAFNGEKRWRSSDKKIYTWDKLHGEIEVFNKRGRHIEVLHPNGSHKSKAIKGRRIDV